MEGLAESGQAGVTTEVQITPVMIRAASFVLEESGLPMPVTVGSEEVLRSLVEEALGAALSARE